jgi:AcrR family transcriptional regulator
MAMTFGKKGRPPQDLLARQREIYEAVSPLILQIGARQLSMCQAASAACLSVGGLYHYFPTKRSLLLHGFNPDALNRHCHDFHAQLGYLAELDPEQFLDRAIQDTVKLIRFVRPAFHAALELSVESFWYVIDNLLTLTIDEYIVVLRRIFPETNEQELHRIGRGLRRSIAGSVLDKTITDDEINDELHALVEGYKKRAGQNLEINSDLIFTNEESRL